MALSEHAHDRHGMLRADEAWLDERWADPATRVLVIAGARVRPVDGRIAWVSPQEAPDGLRVLLGERDGVEHFAVIVDPDDAPGNRDEWVVLRAVVQSLADETIADGPLVLHAIGLAEWLWATEHCPRCGGSAGATPGGPRAALHELRTRPVPPVRPRRDHGRHRRRAGQPRRARAARTEPGWPEGRFSTLAGFVEPGETMEDAVRREVEEETGVRVGEVSLLRQPALAAPGEPDGRLHRTGHRRPTIDVDGSEIEDARWFTREEMRAEAEAGTLVLPGGVSISRSLVESWYGGPLPGRW